ncbi:MAG: tripartite tricarboxylate transporter substrate binding protein [Firmicutes bacterium]|nr:tripartite tricarboxylate transporter substrate binding protein [Bacillota bacterium]
MQVKKFKLLGLLLSLLLVVGLLAGCGGQGDEAKENGKEDVAVEYPTKSIKYVVPFNPGGQSDLEARRQQQPLEEILGTSVVVENKPGGGGAVGWATLVNKKPTGYYLTGMNIPHIILQPLARENAGYETDQINPIALFQGTPIGLAVQPDAPWDTLEEFLADAKDNPGGITVGGSGTWSGHHITLLQLQDKTGTEFQYIPSQGAAPSIQSFLGGNVDALFANSNDLVQHKDNMKILAIGSAETFEPLPDVKTFKEEGVDLVSSIDRGIAAPPGTDEEIIQILEDAFMQIANDEEIQAQMKEEGFQPLAMGAEETKQYIEDMKEKYTEIYNKVKDQA